MKKSPLLKEKLTEQLRRQIHELQTDQLVKIPSERNLSESFEASRVSVRSAIQTLVREGLLVQLQGKGTYIVPAVKLDTMYVMCSPDIKGNDPYYTNFLVEITNLAAKQAIKLSMVTPDRLAGGAVPSPLILIGQMDDELLDLMRSATGQLYSTVRYAHREDIIQIYYDDYRIGSKAAKTLHDAGHRSFALLAGPDRYESSRLRKQGFLAFCQQQEAKVTVITEKMNWEGGRRAADSLLAGPMSGRPGPDAELDADSGAGSDAGSDSDADTSSSSDPGSGSSSTFLPDAIFAVNDWMAAGCIQGLREQGRKVPDEVSIIGCDDIPLASQIAPKLTTFSLDAKHIVEELLSVIHKNSKQTSPKSEQIILTAALVSRASVAAKKTKE
ncbi:GntR family transcriptional regulator [Paenibacillus sp. HB172176]|uniref:GntR family transcriptional regulator n=1 Tax=Paenibacillus sp. HB172176 TaxID=2493690 RepID=UPI0014399187|nr:GntR family transcriptional regulator [Paenibacillus sp. HB172176]